MVKLVHVYIHQKLAGEIAQRQTDVRPVFGVEAPDHLTQKQDRTSALDVLFQNITQDLMIDVGEEFSDVAFQNPNRPRMVARNLASLVAEAIYRPMSALDAPTRVRVENKFWIEVRIQNPIDSMMQKPVPYGSLVNVARLRIVDPECFIRPVLIGFVEKLAVQSENIISQMKRKTFDVFATALISKRFAPRGE